MLSCLTREKACLAYGLVCSMTTSIRWSIEKGRESPNSASCNKPWVRGEGRRGGEKEGRRGREGEEKGGEGEGRKGGKERGRGGEGRGKEMEREGEKRERKGGYSQSTEIKAVFTYQRKVSVVLQHGPNTPINSSEALLSALLHVLCFPHLLPCHWGQNMLLLFLRS